MQMCSIEQWYPIRLESRTMFLGIVKHGEKAEVEHRRLSPAQHLEKARKPSRAVRRREVSKPEAGKLSRGVFELILSWISQDIGLCSGHHRSYSGYDRTSRTRQILSSQHLLQDRGVRI